jgi:hypothetical protein
MVTRFGDSIFSPDPGQGRISASAGGNDYTPEPDHATDGGMSTGIATRTSSQGEYAIMALRMDSFAFAKGGKWQWPISVAETNVANYQRRQRTA